MTNEGLFGMSESGPSSGRVQFPSTKAYEKRPKSPNKPFSKMALTSEGRSAKELMLTAPMG